MCFSYVRIVLVLVLVLAARHTRALAVPGETTPPPSEAPQIAAASDEGELALKGFKVPAGLKGELWAAEPDLANPVAFWIDPRGRIYVCETFRQGRGVEDNRGHEHWLNDDLAAQTVEDRLAYIKKHLGEKAHDYTKHDDRIRLLEDTNADGRADKATVFADRFNSIVEGTLAGVLTRGNDVFLTGIPHLWRLRNNDGDGRADERTSLSYGYGVRFAFRGHDMHGLVIGPDGRLYFSIGDRGLNVKQGGKHFVNPESGAVLRCELDGSNLEMFATGLRNPQELAFDDYGNLFTGDNNSDSGDRARWVHVVEGGDSGWRMAYQYLSDRGPWNREKLWHPFHEGQPACIVPPIANFADGPSGLACYPGTGLPDHFNGRFLLVDFRGGPANSGVRSFRNKPKGATFELVDSEETIWNVLATDVDFGPDGAIYLSDWVNGWNGEGKGRIYRFAATDAAAAARAKETQKLLAAFHIAATSGRANNTAATGGRADGSAGASPSLSIEHLSALLAHADRRVRQEAQFALVDANATDTLLAVAKANASQLARVHAIWGLGQLARRGSDAEKAMAAVLTLLADADSEIRAQAASVLGDARHQSGVPALRVRLSDESPRVRMFASISLGKLSDPSAIEPLLALLEQNADADPVLRHAAVMGLTGAGRASMEALLSHASHASPAARLGVLLALRRLESSEVARFLNDTDPRVVVEAARAIHDVPINDALPQLAAAIAKSTDDDALLRRVLNANYRLGTPQAAAALAKYAGRSDAPEAMRLEALKMLGEWARPAGRDRVLGMWRPLAERPASDAVEAMKANLAAVFSGSGKVRVQAALVATKLEIREVAPVLRAMLADKSQPGQARADALTALDSLREKDSRETAQAALADDAPAVRIAARNVLARMEPEAAIPLLAAAAGCDVTSERQAALAKLGDLELPAAAQALAASLDRLLAGNWPADSRLDLLAAAGQRKEGEIKERLARYESQRAKDDPLAAWHECLAGGDAARGRTIFFERTQVSCVRCHKIGGTGGEVGPDLSKIAADKKRDYLLEAFVLPSKTIAKNFESVVIRDLDGATHTGVLKEETESAVKVMTADGKLLTIAKENIEARKPGKSAMPEDLTKHLTKFEVRDLVEFLAELK
jgi:quinoprotein glucose dehydrogenase